MSSAESPDNPAVAHEHSDVNVRAILIAIGVMIAVAVLMHVMLWLLFEFFAARRAAADPPVAPLAVPAGRPPEPRLQTNPRQDLQSFRALEDALLAGDAPGAAPAGEPQRVSIERAIDLLLERGLPVRPGADARPPDAPSAWSGDSSSGRLRPADSQTSGLRSPASGLQSPGPKPQAPSPKRGGGSR